jgi:hypothetical protein
MIGANGDPDWVKSHHCARKFPRGTTPRRSPSCTEPFNTSAMSWSGNIWRNVNDACGKASIAGSSKAHTSTPLSAGVWPTT